MQQLERLIQHPHQHLAGGVCLLGILAVQAGLAAVSYTHLDVYKRQEYIVYSCAFVIVQLILLWTHASACLQGLSLIHI